MFDSNHSSDEDEESLSKQVLPINDYSQQPVDMNKIPTTGEEYLRQVRLQAARLPNFQTSSYSSKSKENSTKAKEHEWHQLFPLGQKTSNVNTKHKVEIDWQNEQCLVFSNVRNDYFLMRDQLRKTNKNYKTLKLKTSNHYLKFCFSTETPCFTSLNTDDQQNIEDCIPTMTRMIALTQNQLHELLQYEVNWLKQYGCSIDLALYTYATLVAIEKPLSDDAMYTIRQTCSTWKEIRTNLLNSTTNQETSDDSLIKSCDLIVCIVGRYFGQYDLADASD